MDLSKTKIVYRIITIVVGLFVLAILSLFIYLMVKRPDIIPPSETFASFWVRNFSILIAAFAFAASTLASAYNALEDRHLRFMENYPYLEIFPILSVDVLPLPVPKSDFPDGMETFNDEYLKSVAPSQVHKPSAIEFRHCALVLRNVGKGIVTRVTIEGKAEVPGIGFQPVNFKVDRRFNLAPGGTCPFTILPISGLPEYKIQLTSVRYYGHFVDLKEFEGSNEIQGKHPFEIPIGQRDILLYEEFVNIPVGQGWVLDFWGQWKPTDYIFIPPPSQNEHFLLLSGNNEVFSRFPHYNNQAGAYKDLMDVLSYGQTVEITAKVRSITGTAASIQLWCHDLAPNTKNRYTEPIVPSSDWQELSMLYTSTQTSNLRLHVLYTPGAGEIHVDSIKVEKLHT
jgi:hypothetical protein